MRSIHCAWSHHTLRWVGVHSYAALPAQADRALPPTGTFCDALHEPHAKLFAIQSHLSFIQCAFGTPYVVHNFVQAENAVSWEVAADPGLACTKAGQLVDILYQSIVSFKEYCPSHALLSKLLLRTFINYSLTFSTAAL